MSSESQADTLNIPGYEILQPIGQGGMGEVYLARQVSLDRPVALKILPIVPRVDPIEQAGRFRREAELMARIHHPNVVSVYDFGAFDGRPYLVMEYVEGGDLRGKMERGLPLSVDQVRPLVLPVTEALACLHAHGILHRDLKPENILMHRGTTPRLSDFGLAVHDADAGLQTPADRVMGTIGYVAPEQQYGLGVDERTDQYSMAAVMYELLTGDKPLGIMKPPSQFNPRLNRDVDAVLLRALEEDPDDRYPSVQEFGVALDRALSMPAARPRRRTLRTAGAILAIMMVALVVAAGFWSRTHGLVNPNNRIKVAPPPALIPVPVAPAVRLINVVGMILILVPAGEFLMGSPDTDPASKNVEKPRHQVRISRPFYLGANEVTVGQFRAFVAATGYRTEAESSGKGGSVYNNQTQSFEQVPHYNWRNPGLPRPQSDDEPVVQISWNDAVAFCRWLSEQDHRSYRLPTEAEWEYACRGGSTTRWCMGDDPVDLDQFAWIRDQVGCSAHPVGGKRPNAFGLYDMHGNVWEWCLDRFGPYLDSDKLAVDPTGASSGRVRVLRGGACSQAAVDRTRSAARLSRGPSACFHKYGLRVCCPLTEKVEGR